MDQYIIDCQPRVVQKKHSDKLSNNSGCSIIYKINEQTAIELDKQHFTNDKFYYNNIQNI